MELRTITDDEVPAFRECILTAFGDDPGEIDPDGDRRFRALVRPGDAWAMFDGPLIVATAGMFDMAIGMPGGGSLRAAGLTVVTVRATHRRRGILTQLMAAFHQRVRDGRYAVSALWASEATIYGRYGYGVAAWGDEIDIADARGLAIARGTDDGSDDTLEWIDEARAREALPAVYDQATAKRPGVLRRDATWWKERRFNEAPFNRKGASKRRHVLAVRRGQPVGYVQYRQRPGFSDGLPSGSIEIVELHGIDAQATATLWRYVCAIDLFPHVSWGNAPVDDPLIRLAGDSRRVRRTRADTLWLRVEDPVRALAARGLKGSLRIAIGEDIFEIGDHECERARGEVAVSMKPDALPGLLLGATRPGELAASGQLGGAVERAECAFATPVAAWCPEQF